MRALTSNRLIRELFSNTDISEQQLKKIYRDFCKQVHPDITGTDGGDFNILQEEYEEARGYLKKIMGITHGKMGSLHFDPRKGFYKSLAYYNAAGLHSAKVRLRKELKERNNTIIKSVLFWAELYDPEFIQLFLDYNKVYLKSFNRWKSEKHLKNARRLFLEGFKNFLDYQRSGLEIYRRTTASFFRDALFDLANVEAENLKMPMTHLIAWIEEEIKNPPVLY